MTKQELWEEIASLEIAMKTMHEILERIAKACSTPDMGEIRSEVFIVQRTLSYAFTGKYGLISEIRKYYDHS